MKMRTAFFPLLLLVCICAFLPDGFAGKIEINLKKKVVLEDDVITVSDVSTVTGDNADVVNKIRGIEIGNAPGPNSERRIDFSFIQMRLRTANIDVSDVSFTDNRSVLVSVESTQIKGLEIAQQAKDYLLDFLPMDEREMTVETVRIPADQWVPRRRDKIDFSATLIDTRKDKGKIEILISASSNGRLFFKVPVQFNVRVFEYVAIAKKKIGRKQPLTKDNVFVARRETTRIRGTVFSGIDNLKGMVTTTPVQPRTILTDYMVERPPTMKQGSIVKLIVERSGFKIVTKGLAQQTGYKGEVIKVKNINSKKLLYGKVINSDSVQVIY